MVHKHINPIGMTDIATHNFNYGTIAKGLGLGIFYKRINPIGMTDLVTHNFNYGIMQSCEDQILITLDHFFKIPIFIVLDFKFD